MRRVSERELETEFERDVAWGDDERHYYNRNRRKAAVMAYFLRLNAVLSAVKKYSPGSRVVDMASAQGNFALLLAEAGFEVTAVDIHPEFLRYAQKKYTHGSFTCVEGNLMEYRSAAPYDCAILGEVIEHVAHPEQLLATAHANLKPGGVLVLTTPNGDSYSNRLPTFSQVEDLSKFIPRQFHWGEHLFLYTEEELRSLLDHSGFETLEVLKFNSAWISQIKGIRYLLPGPILHWLERGTRHIPRMRKDSTENMLVVARKKV